MGIPIVNRVKIKLDLNLVQYAILHAWKYDGKLNVVKCIRFYFYRMFMLLFLNSNEKHVVKVNGFKLSTIPNDLGISSELLLFQTHEPLSTEILKNELKKGMTCLSVGANIGYYALLEQKLVGEEGRVFAIEPSPLNYSYLKKNLLQNGFTNTPTFSFAFSCNDGTLDFLITPQSNMCRVAKENEFSSKDSIINVSSRSIDSFAKQINLDKLDFLRMDVEGYETEIFDGGWKTIDRFKPALFIELHKIFLGSKLTKKFLQDLRSHGYEVTHYIPRDVNVALIGNSKDVQEIKISQLLEMLSDNWLPDSFHIFLAPSAARVA